MTASAQTLNQKLSALVDAYANGSMAAAEYRQQRRALICEFTGQAVPEVEADGSGEQTHPGVAAVKAPEVGTPVAAAEMPDAVADDSDRAPAKSNKGLYILITAVSLLVALAGAGGLFWYIFRD